MNCVYCSQTATVFTTNSILNKFKIYLVMKLSGDNMKKPTFIKAYKLHKSCVIYIVISTRPSYENN